MTAWLVAAGGGLVLLLATYLKGRLAGAARERDKQTADKLKAAEDRLEMDREATAEERKASGRTDEEARQEALKWAKR